MLWIDGHQAAEEDRCVDLRQRQDTEQARHQFVFAMICRWGQADLLQRLAPPFILEGVAEILQPGLQRLRSAYQRQQCIGQPHQVPLGHARLLGIGIAPPLIGGIGRELGIEHVEPAEGAVVDGQPEHGKIVGVHHPMHETDTQPMRHQHCRAPCDLPKPLAVALRVGRIDLRKLMGDYIVGQQLQSYPVTACSKDLEVAKTHEAWCHASDDGARFPLRVTVVEHVAQHRLAGPDQRQRACGWHTEVVHGLAADELAQRGAQHGTAVGPPRIRGETRTLQLHFPALPVGCAQVTEHDGAAIAELPGPIAELVAAVAGGNRPHARQQAIAGKQLGRAGRVFR